MNPKSASLCNTLYMYIPTYARVYVSKGEKKRNLNKIMKYLRNFPEVNFVGFILMKLTCK